MNNATKLPVYKARAIFSEQRLKNTLFPKRKGMTGEEGEMSLAGLGVTSLVWAPKSRSGLLMEGLFMIFAQSASHHCNTETTMCFLLCRKHHPWSNLTEVGIKSTGY